MAEHFDVIVVGAGLSGIGAACHLQHKCPGKSFAILEARDALGGTWDLFRYPGIRSDSDMYTLGYAWKPWLGEKAVADGASILEYVRETARENEVEEKIRFGHAVKRAAWSTERALWTVEVERGPNRELVQFTCGFLHLCAGYYEYAAGYTPEFAGIDGFEGKVVHPQLWPEDLDYADKRVVVIGSGATAMTLVPSMAKTAKHVTMLQRSPTYVISRPAKDGVSQALRKVLSPKMAYALVRWKNVFLGMLFFVLARLFPRPMRRWLLEQVREEVGPGFDMKHFTPRYSVWDQRVCLVPDGDLFASIKEGRTSVVTDHIDTFTERGIKLRSGKELDADIVVTATGLELRVLGGVEFTVDDRKIELNQTMNYKGCLLSDVPNLACTFGYTNASWTLKADLTADYVCRLLKHMDAIGARQVVPRRIDPAVKERPFLDFSSGYIQRALHKFPTQGSERPWQLYQNYVLDTLLLKYGKLEEPELEFSSPKTARAEGRVPAALEQTTSPR